MHSFRTLLHVRFFDVSGSLHYSAFCALVSLSSSLSSLSPYILPLPLLPLSFFLFVSLSLSLNWPLNIIIKPVNSVFFF